MLILITWFCSLLYSLCLFIILWFTLSFLVLLNCFAFFLIKYKHTYAQSIMKCLIMMKGTWWPEGTKNCPLPDQMLRILPDCLGYSCIKRFVVFIIQLILSLYVCNPPTNVFPHNKKKSLIFWVCLPSCSLQHVQGSLLVCVSLDVWTPKGLVVFKFISTFMRGFSSNYE